MRVGGVDRVASAILGLAIAFVLVHGALLLARRKVAGEGDAASPAWVYLSRLATAAQQKYVAIGGALGFALAAVFLLYVAR